MSATANYGNGISGPAAEMSIDRMTGSFVGLAVGDALGTSAENSQPGDFPPVKSMIGGGPFELKPGEWTDDTSMALCLADSLLECEGFDARDQMVRYARWRKEGYNSSNGRCFDIGPGVQAALDRFEQSGEVFAASTDPGPADNGSLKRLAPSVIAYHREPKVAVRVAAESSRTTHGFRVAIDASRYLAALLLSLWSGSERALGFEDVASRVTDLDPEIEAIAEGSWREKEDSSIRAGRTVVETLEAALWAFDRSTDFRSGALLAANLGGDTEGVGAVYGQIAGAHYGLSGIPQEWVKALHERKRILATAQALCLLQPTR